MPRKSSTAENGEPVQRRASSRIAAIPKSEPEPKKETPKRQAKDKHHSDDSADDVVELVSVSDEGSPAQTKKRGRPSTKKSEKDANEPVEHKVPKKRGRSSNKKNETKDELESAEKADTNVEEDAAKEGIEDDFEIVQKESLPSPNSEEVKKAIEAQGPDGALLVNVVQVHKDELPAINSDEIKEISHKIEAASTIPCSKKPTAIDEPLCKEVINNNGCNGNCGIDVAHEHNGVENSEKKAGPVDNVTPIA